MDKRKIFMLLAQQDQHLQYLIHGHQKFSKEWLIQQSDAHPALYAWLSAYLKLDIVVDDPDIPTEFQQLWQGWLAYNQGKYLIAHMHFVNAWELSCTEPDYHVIVADIALGLGKVYTRSGHWKSARDWLLLSLQYCRQQQRLFGLVQGYGALGELMLRAGYPQAAHACMSTSHHLLPPGSGQQSRQLNYLASTLMRVNAWLRAESLLMSSLFMARDSGDQDSQLHSIARLQFLTLDRDGDSAIDMWERFIHKSDQCDIKTSVGKGFLYIGRALRYQRLNQLEQAINCLEEAIVSHPFAYEQEWARRLKFALDQSTPSVIESQVVLTPHLAPALDSIVDYAWSRLPMIEDGFAWLQQKSLSFSDLTKRRQSFFI